MTIKNLIILSIISLIYSCAQPLIVMKCFDSTKLDSCYYIHPYSDYTQYSFSAKLNIYDTLAILTFLPSGKKDTLIDTLKQKFGQVQNWQKDTVNYITCCSMLKGSFSTLYMTYDDLIIAIDNPVYLYHSEHKLPKKK